MPATYNIGLEIGEKFFRLAEIRIADGSAAILQADEFETAHDFGSPLLHEAPFREELARSFLRDLTQFLRRQKLFASTLSVALPAHVPFVATIPMDTRLGPEEQRAQLEWECAQHFRGADPAAMRIFTQPVGENCDANSLLTVAIPAQTIAFLRKVFSLLTLDLRVVDVDHFLVEHAIRASEERRSFALLGLQEKYFTLSLQQGDTYAGFRIGAMDYSRQHLSPALQALNKLMAQSERRLGALYVYGAACRDSLLHALRSLLEITVIRHDPFAHLPLADPQGRAPGLAIPSHALSAACGAALRRN